MERRDFIIKSSLGAVGTFLIPEFLKGMNLFQFNKDDIKRLIVIQLSGGNDCLNTIIPFRSDLYYKLRPGISVKKNDLIAINDEVGFNTKLKKFHELYDEGLVSVVNSVGYPNPTLSHFRSMDIWHTATDSNAYSKSGWIGRYLDSYCQNSHAALEIDSTLSLSMLGLKKTGLAIQNSDRLFKSLEQSFFKDIISNTKMNELTEDNEGYLYKTLIQTHESANYLLQNHKIKTDNFEFPNTVFGKKCSTVSQLIRSGLNTQVYYISLNGFDTHVSQISRQEKLLNNYSEGVYALVKSLVKSDDFKNTLIFTFSEFGRRVNQNASNGTDHGKAGVSFLIGADLKKKGMMNAAPNLADLHNGDLKFTVDFRNIYADIINEWFNKDANTIISKKFDSLGII